MTIEFTVNGNRVELDRPPTRNLALILRQDLSLSSVGIGCQQGECGGCLVFLDEDLVHACLVPAFRIISRKVLTEEGLVKDRLFNLVDNVCRQTGVFQTGFGTSSCRLVIFDLVRKSKHPTDRDINTAMKSMIRSDSGVRIIMDVVRKITERRGRK